MIPLDVDCNDDIENYYDAIVGDDVDDDDDDGAAATNVDALQRMK